MVQSFRSDFICLTVGPPKKGKEKTNEIVKIDEFIEENKFRMPKIH